MNGRWWAKPVVVWSALAIVMLVVVWAVTREPVGPSPGDVVVRPGEEVLAHLERGTSPLYWQVEQRTRSIDLRRLRITVTSESAPSPSVVIYRSLRTSRYVGGNLMWEDIGKIDVEADGQYRIRVELDQPNVGHGALVIPG